MEKNQKSPTQKIRELTPEISTQSNNLTKNPHISNLSEFGHTITKSKI